MQDFKGACARVHTIPKGNVGGVGKLQPGTAEQNTREDLAPCGCPRRKVLHVLVRMDGTEPPSITLLDVCRGDDAATRAPRNSNPAERALTQSLRKKGPRLNPPNIGSHRTELFGLQRATKVHTGGAGRPGRPRRNGRRT